jgi:hypothetical protein
MRRVEGSFVGDTVYDPYLDAKTVANRLQNGRSSPAKRRQAPDFCAVLTLCSTNSFMVSLKYNEAGQSGGSQGSLLPQAPAYL